MTIDAPLSATEKVLDDVPRYKDLFPDVVDVHVLPGSRDGQRYVTVWEQRVPVFFLPNVIYELANLVDKSTPGLRVYRYKLRRGGSMLASDGMVVLEALGLESTRFTEYDFFNAQWGPLPTSVVWRESLRGAFVSDIAIKLRAENPRWSVERVATEAAQRSKAESELLGDATGSGRQRNRARRTRFLYVPRGLRLTRTSGSGRDRFPVESEHMAPGLRVRSSCVRSGGVSALRSHQRESGEGHTHVGWEDFAGGPTTGDGASD